jgi:hypothetical protein
MSELVDIDTPEGKAKYEHETQGATENKMGTLTKEESERMLKWAKDNGYTVYVETKKPE